MSRRPNRFRPVVRPSARPRARVRLESLETRIQPAAADPLAPPYPGTGAGPALVAASDVPAPVRLDGGSATGPGRTTQEALAADPTIGTIRWNGQPTYAKKGQWLVRFDGVTGTPDQQAAAVQYRLAAAGGKLQVVRPLGVDGLVLAQGAADLTYDAVRASLAALPGFRYAEPNVVNVQADLGSPNDPFFGDLYGLNNTGQFNPYLGAGAPDADIDAPEAWDLTTGSHDVVVAVIDTGTDYTHPDLAANVWTNPGEVPGDGVDNDGDGYVDDVHGYDFVNHDGDPMDDVGHGTHVAGTIGAVGDDGVGVAGVNWHVQVMPVKWIGADGFGTTADAVAAVNYVTQMRLRGVNVRVSNNSWHLFGPSDALHDAIAAQGAAGILFVAAAGNDGSNRDFVPDFPSSYTDLPNMITVAATDNLDHRADFSAYGLHTIDLAAPGAAILSTLPGNTYGWYWGTSMATPHVSGVAALAWSLSPAAGYAQVRDAIVGGVDPIDSLRPDGPTPLKTGGRLNAFKALQRMGLNVTATTPAAGAVLPTRPTDFTVVLSDPYDPATVQPADLSVNGVAADSVAPADDHTLTFHFAASPVTAQGPQTMALAADAIRRAGDGSPLNAFAAQFRYDAVLMQVTATTPAGPAVTLPATSLRLTFNEPYDPASVGTDDLALSMGTVTGFRRADATSVEYTIAGLTSEGTLSVALAAGALTDAFGNSGAAFSASYTLDFGTVPFPTPLGPKPPAGSLVYDPVQPGGIGAPGDTDSFSLLVDPGQKISVVVTLPQAALYGAVGNGSFNSGALLRLDPATAAGAVVGDPVTPGGLTGLAFDPAAGVLLGSTIRNVGNVSTLVRIDPATGALLSTVGLITDGPGGPGISIGDLALQPGTNALYGIGSNAGGAGGRLYTIDKATGVATFVGFTGSGAGGGIAFAPDGSLYQTAFNSGFDFTSLNRLNPADGSRISTVPIPGYFDGLAVRPSDGALLAAAGGSDDSVYLLNPASGAATFIGGTGAGSTSDLAFAAGPGLAPVIELRGPDGTLLGTAAGAAGQDAVLQTVATAGQLGGSGSGPRTYTATVRGAGGTTGAYAVQMILNAAVEAESRGGAPDDTRAAAQTLEASFLPLNSAVTQVQTAPYPGRGAVLGRTDTKASGPTPDYYAFTLAAGESATLAVAARSAGAVSVALENAAGATLAAGAGAANAGGVIDTFVAPAAGTYYARVTGPAAAAVDYTLVVTRNAAFEVESNDSTATAQDLLATEAGGRRWALGAIEPATSSPYATGNDGYELIGIDPAAGTAHAVGPFGQFATYAGAFTPDGTYWTIVNGFDPAQARLATVDLATGLATPVGAPNWTGSPVITLEADAAGNLVTGNWDGTFFSVDKTTGQMTRVGAPGAMGFGGLMDVAFDNDGRLWALDGNNGLWQIDPATGVGTFRAPVTGVNAFAMGLLVDPTSNTMYTTTYAPDSRLYTLDPATGAATPVGAGLGIPYAHGGDFSQVHRDTDYYRVTADENQLLEVETRTPADQGGEFANALNPMVRVYNAAGALVATDDNSAGDGRNALVRYKVPKGAGGTYFVEVAPSAATARPTAGEYILSVKKATGAPPPFRVAATDPAAGSRTRVAPTAIRVDFNDAVLLTTLQAADLTFDGVPATAVTVVDGNTAVFTVPVPVTEGTHTFRIAAGAVRDIQNTPVQAFAGTVTLDLTSPRVVGISLQDGAVAPVGDLTYTVRFSEPMTAANLDASDVGLFGGVLNRAYAPAAAAFDPTGTVLTVRYAGLPEDNYRLTLRSGDGRFEDLVGWDLDGEPVAFPIPPNQSGNGFEGGDFVVNFSLDTTTAAYPTPLAAKPPLGSLIYDPSAPGLVNFPGDTDAYRLNVDAGQTITVAVKPTGTGTLYGAVGNGSFNQGALLRLDPATAVGAVVGDPVTPGGLTGLAFDPAAGVLLGSTIQGAGSTSRLVRIDPATGGLLGTVGPITAGPGGPAISIGDLALQPGTNVLYGIRSNTDFAGSGGLLYTIDKATGVATLVGNTFAGANGGIAFAPDGSLYQTAFNNFFDFPSLNRLDPTTAARISTVPVFTYFDGLTVRPSDGALVAANGGPDDSVYTIDPATGAATFVGRTGAGSTSDLAFGAPPLRPTVELRDPAGNLVGGAAAGPGQEAVLQTVPAATAGVYTITVGAAGGTAGPYTLQATLNAAVEAEAHGGAGNDTPAAAQDLGGSFIDLLGGATRGAALGRADGPAGDVYAFALAAGQSVSAVAKGLNGSDVHLQLLGPGGAVVAAGLTPSLQNGSFETGTFAGWTTVTTGSPFVGWTVSPAGAGSGFFPPTSPQAGAFDAWNGFDGSGPMQFAMTQDVTIAAAAPAAGLSWKERVQWDFALTGTATQPRTYDVQVLDPGTNAVLATLYSFSTGVAHVVGDTGWQSHAADLSAFRGTTVRLRFLEGVPEAFTGPGQIEFDGIDLNVGNPTNVDDSIAGFVAPAAGTYYVRVTGAAGTDYGVVVTRGAAFDLEGNDTPATAQPFGAVPVALGHVGAAGDPADVYAFTAAAGQAVHLFTATPADGPGEFGNTLDPHLRLYDPAGVLVAEGVARPDGRNEDITWTAGAPGTYTVEVTPEGGTAGEYVLDPAAGPGPGPAGRPAAAPKAPVAPAPRGPVTVAEAGGVLTVRGDGGPNAIRIVDDGTGAAGNVSVSADGRTRRSAGAVTAVRVLTGGGADAVEYVLAGNLLPGVARDVRVDLGAGDDTFAAALNEALAAGSRFDLRVVGGGGDDRIAVGAVGVAVADGAGLGLTLLGGAGRDEVDVRQAGPVGGSVRVTADGGAGADRVAVAVQAGRPGSVGATVAGGLGADDLGLRVDGAGLDDLVGWVYGNRDDRIDATPGSVRVG